MEYKSKGSFQSGTYLIDPIQKKGSSSKFSVFCDFENGKFIQYIKLWHVGISLPNFFPE